MSCAPSIEVRRTHFATSDPVKTRDLIEQVYSGWQLQLSDIRQSQLSDIRQSSWEMSLTQVTAGDISSCEVRLPADMTIHVDGQHDVTINTMLGGSIEIDGGAATGGYGLGSVYVGMQPNAGWIGYTHQFHAHTLTLPASLLIDLASEASEKPRSVKTLLSPRADAIGARRWRRITRFVDALLADPEAAAAPLVIGHAARLLAATALSVFPTAGAEPTKTDLRDAHPQALRRAIAFIEANPDHELTIADIARAACVSTRAVQLAFRRHLDTTPMAYLRQVRLGHAHEQLSDAIPDDKLTVTRVALDWGFANPSYFAQHYRATYGQPPSRTLRQ
jgi:AraC-like DNA-binding protein